MASSEELREYFNWVADENPDILTKQLREGSEVYVALREEDGKDVEIRYKIDDTGIARVLKNVPSTIAYKQIHDHFDSSDVKKDKMLRGQYTMPFSVPAKRGVGQCLEKSIMCQLVEQNRRESFLALGQYAIGDKPNAENHAFNIVFLRDEPHLVDIENPAHIAGNVRYPKKWSEDHYRPYIAKIVDIEGNGILKVEEHMERTRFYALWPRVHG